MQQGRRPYSFTSMHSAAIYAPRPVFYTTIPAYTEEWTEHRPDEDATYYSAEEEQELGWRLSQEEEEEEEEAMDREQRGGEVDEEEDGEEVSQYFDDSRMVTYPPQHASRLRGLNARWIPFGIMSSRNRQTQTSSRSSVCACHSVPSLVTVLHDKPTPASPIDLLTNEELPDAAPLPIPIPANSNKQEEEYPDAAPLAQALEKTEQNGISIEVLA